VSSQFLTAKELAATLRISQSTLFRLKAAKVYPFTVYVRIGRRVFFPASLLEDMEQTARKSSFPSGVSEAQHERPPET
jgi:predicted DNA-binding transcriptional regulator AlpA